MGFGLSFGTSKTNTTQNTNYNKATTGTQSGTENTSSTNTSNTTGSQNTSGSTTGTQQQQQQNSSSGSTTNQNTSTGAQSSFSAGTASDIETSIRNLLGGIGAGGSTIADATAKLNSFDPAKFISDTVAGAKGTIQSNLDASTGQLFDNIGGTSSTNSMAALLAGRLNNDAASSLAGVQSQAESTAAGIEQGNLAGTVGAITSQQGLAPALIQALKGGNVTSSQSDLAQQIQALTGANTGTTSSSEQSQQDQTSSSSTIATLTQLIQQLMNTTGTETGTSNSTGTEKKSGGGFSLGF